MSISLTAVDCPTTHQNLLDTLVLLYGRLDEIARGCRGFGGFIAQGELAEKFLLKKDTYPRLTITFLPNDREALSSYAGMSRRDLLACATTPLERLMIAALWKQNDLGKIGYIAAGIVENTVTSSSENNECSAPIFRQFGRHLAEPDNQPIADKHSLRAYRYLLGQNLCDVRHRQGSMNALEVKNYAEWVRNLVDKNVSDTRKDRIYEFDRSMYSLGKATKFFIDEVVIPSCLKGSTAPI